MQLYYIRHGQSENNQLWAQTGSSKGRSEDPGLTPVGKQQAQCLAEFLSQADPAVNIPPYERDTQNVAEFGITHLYTSLMLRAITTAEIIARTLGLPLVAWKDIHEWGGINQHDPETGERVGLPGKNRAYFETHHPDLSLPNSLGEEGWWNRPAEAREEWPLRARRVADELLARHGGTEDRVALVSHGGFFNNLIWAIFDWPERDGHWFGLNNASITRMDFTDEETALCYLNRVDFLPRELIT